MKILYRLSFVVSLLLLSSCTLKTEPRLDIIRLKGSDTMLELARRWTAGYMEQNKDISIYVQGGGSATGFKELTRGNVDIAMASRVINSYEVHELSTKYNTVGLNFLVAKDALSIYINPENPVSNLTLIQLRKIFDGRITNWNQVGGFDEPITVVLRPPSSGTYFYFKRYVLENENYTSNSFSLPTTKKVVNYVLDNRNAIGYGGLAYGTNVKHAHINSIAANEENVRNREYPLTRYLYMYTVDKPTGNIKKFIDWIISAEGQKLVREVGYIPLWE